MDSEERFNMAGGIIRITAGPAGEVFLIVGSEKTAVLDCGMAFCGDKLVENIKKELKGRKLDYAILTHTHYDHIGGLPYLRKEWPELTAFGAEYGKKVLEKPTALKVILELSKVAWRRYREDIKKPPVLMDGLKIDKVVHENDKISLGDKELLVLETPGHTTCSLTFVMEAESIIFPSETIGVFTETATIISPILKSYHQAMKSIEKCRRVNAKYIISPHFGQVPDSETAGYWDKAVMAAEQSKSFILKLRNEGISVDEILVKYTEKFWIGSTAEHQPKEAFILNAQNIIKTVLKEFGRQGVNNENSD